MGDRMKEKIVAHRKEKCKKHNIYKEADLGGVMFCDKCLFEGGIRYYNQIIKDRLSEQQKQLEINHKEALEYALNNVQKQHEEQIRNANGIIQDKTDRIIELEAKLKEIYFIRGVDKK